MSEAIRKYGDAKGRNWSNIGFGYNVGAEREPVEPIQLDDENYGLNHSWSFEIWNLLTGKNWNKRLLNWVVDFIGGIGKTEFNKLFLSHHANALVLKNVAGCRDIATALATHLETHSCISHIIIDLARRATDKNIYDTIENLLDGQITVMKYKGRALSFEGARVIIFSNWYPPYTTCPPRKHNYDGIDDSESVGFQYTTENPDRIENAMFSKIEGLQMSEDRWHIGVIRNGDLKETTDVDEKGEPIFSSDKYIHWVPNLKRTATRGRFKNWMGLSKLSKLNLDKERDP